MTREEALKEFVGYQTYDIQPSVEATKMAIEALKQELSGDLISRDELLKTIDTWDKFGCDADTKLVPYQDHYIPYIHYDDVIKCIKGMPLANPQEPKTGHWIKETIPIPLSDTGKECVRCSECNLHYDVGSVYCPNCGAKMRE